VGLRWRVVRVGTRGSLSLAAVGMQFREVSARTFCKAMLLESTALYIVAETPEKMPLSLESTASSCSSDTGTLGRDLPSTLNACAPRYHEGLASPRAKP
jgi:hypothetical protein